MTPYNIYYFTYNRCLNHFFFWQEKETLHQRKSACELRSPAAPRGARTPLISPWSHGFMMKKALLLSRWLCELPWIKIFRVPISLTYQKTKFSAFIIHKKVGFLVNLGRLALASALGELPSEHVVFNIFVNIITLMWIYFICEI